MTPTLIVPGPASDWLPTAIVASPFIANVHEPKLCWVPVTTLPAVPSDEWVSEDRGGGYSEIVAEPRPLRAGDTVELALWDGEMAVDYPFAAAEVAAVWLVMSAESDWVRHINDGVILTYEHRDTGEPLAVEAKLGQGCGLLPGDWSSAQYGVRLTNVEALSGHVDSAVTPEEAQALRVESINERHARLQGESR